MNTIADRVALLGIGHLGEAVLTGLLASGYPPAAVTGTALPAERAERLSATHGVRVGTDNTAAVRGAALVLLAVPPAAVIGVAAAIGPALAPGAVVVSLAAGVPTGRIEPHLPPGTPVVRAMTNTAARIGRAATALSPGRACDAEHRRTVGALFDRLGASVVVDEDLQDTATAVAGSGPAFLYRLAAALIDAATARGLPDDAARLLVTQTLDGAAATLRDSGGGPADLVAAVATPGGTTRAALDRLDRDHIADTIAAAVTAAVDRSHHLTTD